ncbi:hypothetical protein [Candidatus Pelagibacter sp. HIMB1509]|uniref:hypothetical protein n=1 Tax=Candidatus Pelagibacter sp. HIMB1509 TaxID=3413339 RepID=UPI003F827775
MELLVAYFFCFAFYGIILNLINEDDFKHKKITEYVNNFFLILIAISIITFLYSAFSYDSCYRDSISCQIENVLAGSIVGFFRALQIFFFPTYFYFQYF